MYLTFLVYEAYLFGLGEAHNKKLWMIVIFIQLYVQSSK